MSKLKNYTPMGARIDALCGPQHRIAAALGLHRTQVSRKLRGEISISAEELENISTYFRIPIWMFFGQPDMDHESFAGCYRMFVRDAFALDRIIDAFDIDPKNLRKLGEIADEMRRAHNREKRKHDSKRG